MHARKIIKKRYNLFKIIESEKKQVILKILEAFPPEIVGNKTVLIRVGTESYLSTLNGEREEMYYFLKKELDKKAIDHWRIPIIEDQDIDRGLSVLVEVARLLLARCEEATRILQQRKPALSQAQINALASVAE